MADVLLSETDQWALRQVLAAEPVHGRPLPPDVLRHITRLIPCDAIGIALGRPGGAVIDSVELPVCHTAELGNLGSVGVPRLGITHWASVPGHAEPLRAVGLADSLCLAFHHDRDLVAHLWLDRWTGRFSDRDVAVLGMITPALRRLVGRQGGPELPPDLTAQERRTLSLVAAGLSNPEIAIRMSVATCTVRKHLEHAYRKLGVTNRVAAAAAVQGRHLPSGERLSDAEARDQTFA